MTIKSALLAGTLFLASIPFANARTHEIILDAPAIAGGVQLPAGPYSVKVEGESAIFTNLDKDKTFTAPVKQETGAEKFDRTAVKTEAESGSRRITEIDLGGSHTRLEFTK